MLAHRLYMAAAGVGGVKIPVGLILLHNSAAIPSGWQRFSAADGRMIVGAGGSYGVGATGGSWSTGAIGSASAGGHSGHGTQSQQIQVSGYYAGLNNAAGAHAHTVYPTYIPYRQAAILIKAVTPGKKVPANAVVLATGALTGLSAVFNNNYYLMGYSSISGYAPQLSGSVGAAGSHEHGQGTTQVQLMYGAYYDHAASGSHGGHTATLSLQAEYIKAVVLRALSSGVDYDLQAGMYGFWEGATAPEGWIIETSIADYFIKINSGGAGTVGGNNTVTLSGTLGSYDAYHSHAVNQSRGPQAGNPLANYNQAINWAHSHSIGAQNVGFLMPYYALKIIRYIG